MEKTPSLEVTRVAMTHVQQSPSTVYWTQAALSIYPPEAKLTNISLPMRYSFKCLHLLVQNDSGFITVSSPDSKIL
jgi:hypothetical protein